MTINNQIEALSIKNTMVKPVNMTEFNNPFLLLSSTKALNELVVNTNPSSRAKVADIEPKTKFQKDPTGVPINVYTKDTATTPQVPKLKGADLKGADLMAARNARAAKRRAFITGNKQKREDVKQKAISKLSKQTASSAISSALSNVDKAKPKATPAKATPVKATPAKATPVKAPHTGGGKAGGGKAGKTRAGAPNQGKTAARAAEATKKRVAKAKAALQKAGAGGMGVF